jgi:hypothetical protein
MSCYEWERGTIKLPSKDYPRFRKEMLAVWNNNELRLFNIATACFKELKAKPIKRAELESVVNRLVQSKTNDSDSYRVFDMLVARTPTNAVKLRAPRKGDLSIRKVSVGCAIDIEEAQVYFDDKACSVTWAVSENNHARDHAREHPIARELFRKLGAIEWVRGTGGTIVGNDEYNRDNDYEGGGSNYITAYYGPESGRRLHRY